MGWAWRHLADDIAEEMGDLRLDRHRSEHGLTITRLVSHVDPESLSQTRRASALSDTRTHAERSAAVKAGNAVRTPAKRSEIARKAQAARNHEGHAEAMRRYWAQFTPEQRSERARAREAGKTAEQRELAIAKGRAARERQLAKARRAA